MLRRFRQICAAIALLAFVPLVPAQAQQQAGSNAAPERDALIDTLLAHSQVGDVVGTQAEQFRQTVQATDLRLSAEARARLREAGTAAFDSSRLARSVRQFFEDRYRPQRAAEAARRLQSEMAHRVERAARSDADPEAIQQYAQRLQSDPPSPERRALIQRMAKAQRATQFYVDNLLGMNRAVARAAQALGDAGAAERTRPDRAQMQRQARIGALISFLYLYDDVPGEALEPYVDFYESEAGQWFVRTYSAAVRHATGRAAEALTETLEAAP